MKKIGPFFLFLLFLFQCDRNTIPIREQNFYYSPVFSPDGKQIAYIRHYKKFRGSEWKDYHFIIQDAFCICRNRGFEGSVPFQGNQERIIKTLNFPLPFRHHASHVIAQLWWTSDSTLVYRILRDYFSEGTVETSWREIDFRGGNERSLLSGPFEDTPVQNRFATLVISALPDSAKTIEMREIVSQKQWRYLGN